MIRKCITHCSRDDDTACALINTGMHVVGVSNLCSAIHLFTVLWLVLPLDLILQVGTAKQGSTLPTKSRKEDILDAKLHASTDNICSADLGQPCIKLTRTKYQRIKAALTCDKWGLKPAKPSTRVKMRVFPKSCKYNCTGL